MATQLMPIALPRSRATLICEHLLAHGYHRGIDPIWLVRLLVARLTLERLLERLQRR